MSSDSSDPPKPPAGDPGPPGDDGNALWATPDQARFFLIPDGVSLLPGELLIVRLLGGEQHADPKSLEQYEITKEQAGQRLTGKVTSQLQGMRDAFERFRKQAAERIHQGAGKTGEGASGATAPGTQVPNLAALMPSLEVLKEGLTALVTGFASALQSVAPPASTTTTTATSAAPPADAAKAAEEPLGAAATAHASDGGGPKIKIDVENKADAAQKNFAEQLRAVLSSPEVAQTLHAAADKLNALAEQMKSRPRDDDKKKS